MRRNVIYCFTGTGNSLATAWDIAEALGDTAVLPMRDALEGEFERVGFVFPTYCFGLPLAVERFIGRMTPCEGAYYFAVATYGGSKGNSLADAKRRLSARGIALSYGNGVRMPGSYVALYPMKSGAQEAAKAARAAISPLIEDIKEKRERAIDLGNPIGRFAHGFFTKRFAAMDTHYTVSDRCTGCGVCAGVCPVRNIRMENGHPAFSHACEQCMACIQHCPAEALNHKDKTQSRGRYRHPGVSLDALLEFNGTEEAK